MLNDGEVLYRTLYPTYVALTEDLARELVERLVADKGVARTSFAGMKAGNISEAAERYVTDVAMEVWGDAILKASGRDWSESKAASAPSLKQ